MATRVTAKGKATAGSQSSNSGVFDEISHLVQAVKDGKLGVRADVARFEGQDQVMLEGVNELIEATQDGKLQTRGDAD